MEKDNRRFERFKKSKKFKEKHPHSKGKRNEKVRTVGEANPQREVYKSIAQETLAAVNQGFYEYNGNQIKIFLTPYTYYDPQSSFLRPSSPKSINHTCFKIVKKTTIQACKDIYFSHTISPCALVFASAKNPGGGWLKGANAQEESITRCSALYNAVQGSPMYAQNMEKTNKRGVYTHAITYCPMVPIFRDEDGNYEAEIYYADFVLCPAVNLSICRENAEEIMNERIDRILNVMCLQGKKYIILGSYGCGVFGNDPENIAIIFEELLNGKYANVFDTVVFAVVDDDHYKIFNNYFQTCFS